VHDYAHLLQIVAPVFLLMAAGFALRRMGILTTEADRSILGVIVNLLYPCLALHVIIGNEAFSHPKNLILPPLAGFFSIAIGLLVGQAGARVSALQKGPVSRTFIHTTGLQNYGYIALPLCQALFDVETVGVLFAYNLGVELAFWSIALSSLTGHMMRIDWKKAINPPIIAVLSGLLLNSLGAVHWLPGAVQTSMSMLGACSIPLALVVTGAVLADFTNFHTFARGWRTTIAAWICRLGITPILILIAAHYLPFDRPLKNVLIVQAAMPAAIFPIMTTRLYGGDVATALRVVLGTSLLGLITIPLWLAIGHWWVK